MIARELSPLTVSRRSAKMVGTIRSGSSSSTPCDRSVGVLEYRSIAPAPNWSCEYGLEMLYPVSLKGLCQHFCPANGLGKLSAFCCSVASRQAKAFSIRIRRLLLLSTGCSPSIPIWSVEAWSGPGGLGSSAYMATRRDDPWVAACANPRFSFKLGLR